MAETAEVTTTTPTELIGVGRRHLAVRDFSAAVETLAKACEVLAKEHGDTADQCAEAYLWYGKALLGLSREESGVLGDGVPGTNNADEEEENEDQEENEANGEAEPSVEMKENGEKQTEVEKNEAESTTKDDEPVSTVEPDAEESEQPGTSNGEANDEAVDMENDDDVDNLQLAWEMLDLSRSILRRRSGADARALLADVHLALGEVALESETYDKAVLDMQSCLEIQKELYRSDDRRIAETYYQMGLANSLASNFEEAITSFKNAANILETRIKTLEAPAANDDATVKKYASSDPSYSVEGEIKELKELLPEIQEKIQDMMDYKAETIKRVRESLFSNGNSSGIASSSSNGAGSSSSNCASSSNGSAPILTSSSQPKAAASNISHLIKRKRKSSESAEASPAKKPST